MNGECIFCKIASGEIPTNKVFENQYVMAFLDINPCAPGHTVVAPKRHFALLTQMPSDLVKDLFAASVQIEDAVRRSMAADGMNVGVNDGEVAGQGVAHVHVHIIPRFRNDKGGSMHSIVRAQVNKELIPKYAQQIKSALGGGQAAPKPAPATTSPTASAEKKDVAKPKKKWHFLEE